MGRWPKAEKTRSRRKGRIEELLDLMRASEPWMTSATCRSIGTEAWFPSGKSSDPDDVLTEDNRDAAYAKRICRTRCPVREECLEYAIRSDQEYGIWGGLTRNQRNEIRGSDAKPRSLAGRVQRPREETEDEMKEPICICSDKEKETEQYDPECPRHRKKVSWADPDDWS